MFLVFIGKLVVFPKKFKFGVIDARRVLFTCVTVQICHTHSI